jgi:hypothetical protein
VQKFTPLDDGPDGVWTTVADYPSAAAGIAAAWDGGNYIYAAGGSNLTSVYQDAYRYDIVSDQWETIAPLPMPMTYHGGVFIDGRFHVMGGVQEPSTAHFIYDPEADTWSEGPAMPVPNYFATFSLAQTEDRIISVGGGGGYYIWPATDAVQVYDPVMETWLQETPLPFVSGLNAVAGMPDGSVVSSGGFEGYQLFPYTFKGTGFPTGNTRVMPGVNEQQGIAGSPVFHPAYPNPFNARVTLQFTLTEPSRILLTLIDLNGCEVAHLADGLYPSGLGSIHYDAENLTSGIYIAKLKVLDFAYRQKVILIK